MTPWNDESHDLLDALLRELEQAGQKKGTHLISLKRGASPFPFAASSADVAKTNFNTSIANFLSCVKQMPLGGTYRFPVTIPDHAHIEIGWFSGERRRFVIAMWSVRVDQAVFGDTPPTTDKDQGDTDQPDRSQEQPDRLQI